MVLTHMNLLCSVQSYAGKYVPAISYYIHKNNPNAKVKINLAGMAIGDGLCDPEMVRICHPLAAFKLGH